MAEMTPTEIVTWLRTASALAVLALTLWGEARGESFRGALAVGWVIRNRAARRRQTIQTVCLQPAQFSCWPPYDGDANEHAVLNLARAVFAGVPLSDKVWLACVRIADQVLTGALADPTGGADHYMTVALHHEVLRAPEAHSARWCLQMTRTVTVDRHIFFRSGRQE